MLIELQLDVTVFGQCLSLFSTQMAERMQEFKKIIVEDAVTLLTKVCFSICWFILKLF